MCNCYPTISLDTAARVLSHNPSGLNVRIGSPPWNIRLAMNYERPTFAAVRIRSNAQRACARRYAKRDPENIIEKRRNSAGLKMLADMIYRVFQVTVTMRLYVAIWLTMKMFIDEIKHFRVPYIYVENTNFPNFLIIIFVTIYCHLFDSKKFNILEVD